MRQPPDITEADTTTTIIKYPRTNKFLIRVITLNLLENA